MRWFRMHSDAIANPKLKLLAFEDRWHFVAVCCMKAEGLLDDDRNEGLRERLIAAQLGLTLQDAAEVKRRLAEVDLIRENWQPKGWSKYQYESDNSTDRVRKYREKKQQRNGVKRYRNVSVTPPDTDTDTETDTKKRKNRLDLSKLPADLSPEIWADFVRMRAEKKKPISTQTAVTRLANRLEECRSAGFSPDDALGMAVEKGWQSVEVEWLQNSRPAQTGPKLKLLVDQDA